METVQETVDSRSQIDERLLRAPEVAQILGLGRSKVYDMMQSGELPVVHIGRAIRVPMQALQAWIRGRTIAALQSEDVDG
jgi:excisionase family DNA binding protein